MGSTAVPPPFWANDIHHSPSVNSSFQLPTFKVAIDDESVRSGHSERSRRNRGHNSHGVTHSSSNHVMIGNSSTLQHNGHHRSNHRSASRHSHRSARSDRGYLGKGLDSMDDRRGRGGAGEEVIEVQIVPQDDNWADNTTAVTGNTSDHSVSIDGDLNRVGKDSFWREQSTGFKCQMWSGTVVAVFLSACAFLSPIVMVILPRVEALEWKVQECGPECDGLLISFSFKLLILLVGTWALFFRRPRATMPRIFIYRSVVLALIFVFMVSYWLFYAVRVAERRFSEYDLSYQSIVVFAVSLVDALLFIHYLAVILIEVRHLQPQYFVKVVRSPDGHSQSYNIGELSIQRAAVWILERYYQDFPIYNPYLETLPSKKGGKSLASTVGSMTGNGGNNHIMSPTPALKYYDVDGLGNNSIGGFTSLLTPTSSGVGHTNLNMSNFNNRSHLSNHVSGGGPDPGNGPGERTKRGRGSSSHHHHHNERFYEEHEYERRVKKRRARLITATEEAFTHIKRVHDQEQGPAIPMDCQEAAQAIFPSMAKALQKYLRITRQQPRHSMQAILEHLGTCLSFDISPKGFLEKYLVSSPILQSDKEQKPIQTWGLVCDVLLSRSIEAGTLFMLRQGDLSLLVTIQSLPHFNITEEVIDPKNNKFVFRLNSETSV